MLIVSRGCGRVPTTWKQDSCPAMLSNWRAADARPLRRTAVPREAECLSARRFRLGQLKNEPFFAQLSLGLPAWQVSGSVRFQRALRVCRGSMLHAGDRPTVVVTGEGGIERPCPGDTRTARRSSHFSSQVDVNRHELQKAPCAAGKPTRPGQPAAWCRWPSSASFSCTALRRQS